MTNHVYNIQSKKEKKEKETWISEKDEDENRKTGCLQEEKKEKGQKNSLR